MLGSGIFNCDGPIWRFQRKVASYVFTSSSLKDFVIEIASMEIQHRLLPALDSACTELAGCPIDLQALMLDFTFDTISQLTFGADPACLTTCKVVISQVDADVRHKEMHVEADVKYDDRFHVQRCDTHEKVNVQHTSQFADAYMKVPNHLIQGFVGGFQVAIQTTANRFLMPTFMWKTQRALRIGSERKLFYALKSINKFAAFAIDKSKRNPSSEPKDLLSRFTHLSGPHVESLLAGEDEAAWKASNDEHGQILSDSFLRDILLSFLFAGREAVVSGIVFLMWLLSLHPTVERTVYEEVKRIVNDRKPNKSPAPDSIKSENMGIFSFEELKRMKYLHAAVLESMRLYPPVPSNPKFAAQDDVLPNGMQIRKGDQVSYNVFAMGRAEKVWGKDCLEFRPERWIGEDGQLELINPYKYPVFQAGPRICLGKDLALVEMKMVVASLVENFEFKLSTGFKPKMAFGATLIMRNGLPMIIKRRQQEQCA